MEEKVTRVERLLAWIMLERMEGRPLADKAVRLQHAGFANSEIADMLGTTSATIAQTLYVARRDRKAPKAPSASKEK